ALAMVHDDLWSSDASQTFEESEIACFHASSSPETASPHTKGARHFDYEQMIAGHDAVRPETSISPEDPARLRYTSGTTGRAKAAILPHRVYMCSLQNLTSEVHDLSPEDNVLHAAPLTHAAGALVFPVLAAGGTNVLLPRFEAEAVLATIEREKISLMFAVPTMLLRLFESPGIADADVSSIRTISYGGAPMPVEPLNSVIERIGTSLLQIYGLTEATHPITTLQHAEHRARNPKLGSIGKCTPFCTIRLLDDEGQEVAPGEVGEMVVSGDNTMSGYWNDTEATDEVLEDGWVYTGDLAYCDADGYHWIVDRKKDVIITGGFNVYSAEVEHTLMEHPDVSEAAVIGLPHDDWGEEVCAVVTTANKTEVDGTDLITFCRERLAGYKTPKRVFIQHEPLPKNNSGKILKKKIIERIQTKVIGKQ
ncbi:MAG: AMP-binding protein, partial [Candidatus Hydrogenedentota bacterium]